VFWLLMHGLVLSYIARTKPQPCVYLHARCVCRLSRINDSLARKVASRNEYDKTIMETEAAYMKILESSQVAACACACFIYICDVFVCT